MTVLDAATTTLRQSVGIIMAWRDDDIVRRYCADHNATPDDGEACFAAFKQFMVICGTSSSVRAPSEPVDDMWHTALLFTRAYRDFCTDYLGAFVHHLPVTRKADVDIYHETRRLALEVFGALDNRYWPESSVMANCGGCASIYVP